MKRTTATSLSPPRNSTRDAINPTHESLRISVEAGKIFDPVERAAYVAEACAFDAALTAQVEALLSDQDRRCAITNLPLQLDGQEQDKEFLPSLDRIDSNAHYEPGNLQVVCRFVNRWKS